MKLIKNETFKFLVLYIVLFSIFSIRCIEPNNIPTEKPQIPSISTLSMDFSNFKNDTIISKNESTDNWYKSALKVINWYSVIYPTQTIPEKALEEAGNYKPVYEAGSWLWSYTINIEDVEYKVKLYGTVETLKITWDLYISKEGYYTDFLWLTGFQNISGTEGQWQLFKNYSENYDYLQIDWSYNKDEDWRTVKYKNISPGSIDFESYILYSNSNDSFYDSFFEICKPTDNDTTIISWNSQLKYGKSKSSKDFFFKCWDEYYFNVDCPEYQD